MKHLILFSILLFLFSCKKAEDRTCVKSAGDNSKLEISLESFDKISVGPKIEVELIQSSQNKIVIHGSKNLIGLISYDINSEGQLVLKNKNKCDYLRKYSKNKIKVEVYFVNLSDLHFEGTYDLTTRGIINTPDIKLNIQDGGGTVYLNLNCTRVTANQGHGYGDFVLKGTCQDAYLRLTSNGFCNTKELSVSNSIYVISNTPVRSSVNLDNANAFVEINGSGNVEYIGLPNSLSLNIFSTGSLVKID